VQCITYKAPLHYHTSGMTCRSCGFTVDHELLLDSKCASCGHLLEESEKTAGICIFCQYDIVRGSK
jgi:predicted Zn-ribbon and HTH transcriptional regulator